MGDVVKFQRPKLSEKHRGKTLCQGGFHKWAVVKESQFDVKQGKLVTHYKCCRCSELKTKII